MLRKYVKVFSINMYCCQVSVPCNSMMTIVTVRCGHCANLLSVNIGSLLQSLPLQDLQVYIHIYY